MAQEIIIYSIKFINFMTTSIFIDISVILGIAIGIAFLVQLLKQPMIISYIITGIICGPVFLNLINSNQEFFDVFANFGVILLLFLVGLRLVSISIQLFFWQFPSPFLPRSLL